MNCPLCKSTVLYVGLNTIECKGRKCENFKGEKITKVTREFLREFFGKVSFLSNPPKTWSMHDQVQTTQDAIEGIEYVEIRGFEYPLIFLVGPHATDIDVFEKWVTLFDPTWVSCL